MKYDILVIDDHPIVGIALSSQLRGAFHGRTGNIVCADSVDTAIRLIEANRGPWLVTLDLCMPGLHGLDAIRAVRDTGKVRNVVIVSSLDHEAWEPKCRAAGADAFVPKLSDPQTLIRIVSQFVDDARADPQIAERIPASLTPRQFEVLSCMAAGLSNKLIGRHLGIAEMTVKVHITQILRSLNANNRTHAVRLAREIGILA